MSGRDKISDSLASDAVKEAERERHYNRPGLSFVRYRLGTQGTFHKRMLDKLRAEAIIHEDDRISRPLESLAVRTGEDPAIALLECWAMVADVLSFYQERIANEGYLRTATERRSVLELARTVGYELNPGVAASTHLVFKVEDAKGAPGVLTVSKGTQVMSIPSKGQMPQTFETMEEIEMRAEWNELKPYNRTVSVPQEIVKGITSLLLKGIDTGLIPDDPILLVGEEREKKYFGSERWDVRRLQTVEPNPKEGYTKITWEEGLGHDLPYVDPAAKPKVFVFRQRSFLFGHEAANWKDFSLEDKKLYVAPVYSEVKSVAYISRTKFLSGHSDGAVKLWSIRSGRELSSFTISREGVNCLAFSASGKKVAFGMEDNTIHIWNIESASELCSFSGHTGPVTCIAFSNDSKKIASGSEDKTIRIWDLENETNSEAQADGEPLVLEGHSGTVNTVAFSHDDHFVLSGSEDKTVKLWDATSGAITYSYDDIESAVNSVDLKLYVNRLRIIAGCKDGAIKVWESVADVILSDGQPNTNSYAAFIAILALKYHNDEVTCVALSPDGKSILSGGKDHALLLSEIFKKESGDTFESWPESIPLAVHKAPVTCIKFSKSGARILSGSSDSCVKRWKADNGEELKEYSADKNINRIRQWPNFKIDAKNRRIDLDSVNYEIQPGSWIALLKPKYTEIYRAENVSVVEKKEFGMEASVTRIDLDTAEHLGWFPLRKTEVLVKSEQLELLEEQKLADDPLEGDFIELDRLSLNLKSEQTVMVIGKRLRVEVCDIGKIIKVTSGGGSDENGLKSGESLLVLGLQENEKKWRLENKKKVTYEVLATDGALIEKPAAEDDETVSEIAYIETVDNSGDRTKITLKKPLKNYYDRNTVVINANVVNATHGETANEILGSGEGSKTNQCFYLKKPPLTHIPAMNARGSESSLDIKVNGVSWDEAPSLYGLTSNDQSYITRIDDNGDTYVIFGDGEKGARLPTGQENLIATYRSGIGPEGEVEADSLRLLKIKPPGIREVTNALPATGAAAPETRDYARKRAPLTVLTLDRIVSLYDFENFAQTFAGIGKAKVAAIKKNGTEVIHLTIGSESGEEVNVSSELYKSLVNSIDLARYRGVLVIVDSYREILFNFSTGVILDKRYEAESVTSEVKRRLTDRFRFENRDFAQEVTAAEIIMVIQEVPGVLSCDLNELYYTNHPPQGNLEAPSSILVAKEARLEAEGNIKPAELLLINPQGITVEEKRA